MPEPDKVELTGFQAVREALRARRRPLYRLRLREGAEREERAELRKLAEQAGVSVVEGPLGAPRQPSEARSQLGIRLDAGPLPVLQLADLVEAAQGEHGCLVALDGVEDPQNLGAIARVADAAGVSGLLLTSRHAAPLSPAVSRASAGAIEWLPTARVANLSRALNLLKKKDFWIFGADLAEDAETLFTMPERVARGRRVVVLGAEGRGLRPGVVRCLDHRVKIPMGGRVASLNVATAAAVILFEFARRDAVVDTRGEGS